MRNDEAKRKEELHATRSFLAHRSWQVLLVEEKHERPDVRVHVCIGGTRTRLGVEATQYDAGRYESKDSQRLTRGTVVHWQSLQEGIEKRVAQYSELASVWGHVLFRDNSAPTPKQKDAFVGECVALAREVVTGSAWTSASGQTLATFPQNHPLLQRYVKCLQLLPGPAAQHRWQVGTRAGSFGGPSWDWVLAAVANKSKKLRQYDTGGLDEVWLLIYCLPPAGKGRHVATTLMSPRAEFLGPPTEEVVAAVRVSGFDRLFLYNHMSGWDMELSARPDESPA